MTGTSPVMTEDGGFDCVAGRPGAKTIACWAKAAREVDLDRLPAIAVSGHTVNHDHDALR